MRAIDAYAISQRFDLRNNYLSLVVAVLSPQPLTPDKALSIIAVVPKIVSLRDNKPWTEEDAREMQALKSQGLTWHEVGAAYGITGDNAYHIVKRLITDKEG